MCCSLLFGFHLLLPNTCRACAPSVIFVGKVFSSSLTAAAVRDENIGMRPLSLVLPDQPRRLPSQASSRLAGSPVAVISLD